MFMVGRTGRVSIRSIWPGSLHADPSPAPWEMETKSVTLERIWGSSFSAFGKLSFDKKSKASPDLP